MDWNSFLPNIIATLTGVIVAFLLGFIGYIIQEKITNYSTKKEWTSLLTKELNQLKNSLTSIEKNNIFSFINIPIIDSFLKNSTIQQLFPYDYLAELCNIYCKVQNYNKYIEIKLLNPKSFDDNFFYQKINKILELCNTVQELKNDKQKLCNRSDK